MSDRITPAVVTTHVTLYPTPTGILSSGAQDVLVSHFNADSNHFAAAANRVVMDDVVQGALSRVRTGSLSYESSPGVWTHLDSSPVTNPRQGGLLVFNFGRIPLSGPDGVNFRVDVDAVDAAFAPVNGDLAISDITGRYLGKYHSYTSRPAPGTTVVDDPLVPNDFGAQRSLYTIKPLSLAEVTVNANDRDKVVWDGTVDSSDWRAYFRCIRFVTKDSQSLPFVRTASLMLEISPGVWDRVMTVAPNVHGQLVLTIYKIGRDVHTGDAAHIQVRVDTDPAMIGSRPADVGFYFSTFRSAGDWIFAPGATVSPPSNPPTHGMLSSSSVYYPAQAGNNAVIAVMTIGSGPNEWFDRIDAYVTTNGTGSFAGATNFRVHKAQYDAATSTFVAVGQPLGNVTYLDSGAVTIEGIGELLTEASHYMLVADLATDVQIGQLFASG